MGEHGGERLGFGVPLLNPKLRDLVWRFAVSQSYAGSVLLDFVGIDAEGYVFVGAFVSCAAMLVFEHLGEIRGRLPPWRLDAVPGVGKHREHRETDQ